MTHTCHLSTFVLVFQAPSLANTCRPRFIQTLTLPPLKQDLTATAATRSLAVEKAATGDQETDVLGEITRMTGESGAPMKKGGTANVVERGMAKIEEGIARIIVTLVATMSVAQVTMSVAQAEHRMRIGRHDGAMRLTRQAFLQPGTALLEPAIVAAAFMDRPTLAARVAAAEAGGAGEEGGPRATAPPGMNRGSNTA